MQDKKHFLSRNPQTILDHYEQLAKSILVVSIVLGAILGITSLLLGLGDDGEGTFIFFGTTIFYAENFFAFILVLMGPFMLCAFAGGFLSIIISMTGNIIAHLALLSQSDDYTYNDIQTPVIDTPKTPSNTPPTNFVTTVTPPTPKPGVYCPSCQAKNDGSRTSCRICGASLPKSHK